MYLVFVYDAVYGTSALKASIRKPFAYVTMADPD